VRKTKTLISNPDRQNLIQLRDTARLQIEVDSVRMAAHAEARDRARADLESLTRLGPRILELENAVQAARATVEQTERACMITEKSQQLTAAGISSLKVSQEPTLPLQRSGPRRGRIVFGGLLVGLLAGMAVLLLRALTDPTVRGPEDIEKTLEMKMLAAIPNLSASHVRRHRSLRVTSWS
jgi:uncharacterized protein involved in exopolysaccharide biosynthesis